MRISSRTEDVVEGVATGAEFGDVRHRIDDSTLVLEVFDEHVRARGNVVGQSEGSEGVSYSGNGSQVLDGNGKTGQDSPTTDAGVVGPDVGEQPGVGPRPFEAPGG